MCIFFVHWLAQKVIQETSNDYTPNEMQSNKYVLDVFVSGDMPLSLHNGILAHMYSYPTVFSRVGIGL